MKNFKRACATLEFNKIRDMLASCAFTEGSVSVLKSTEPETDPYFVSKLLRQTTDAKRLCDEKGIPPFGSVKDITEATEQADKGATLSPMQILDICAVYTSARGCKDYIATNVHFETCLDEMFGFLISDKHFEDRIHKVIIAPDLIADDATPELSDIRRKIRVSNNKVKEILHKFTTGNLSKYLQDNIVTTRDCRYVIPVKVEYKNEVRGLIHDTSSSGATVFIEPMSVVEENNKIKELSGREEAEILRILSTLSSECSQRSGDILLNYRTLTNLAVIFARAEFSKRINGIEPQISDGEYSLIRARHPLLDKEKAVPITIKLGGEWDTLVITGPNTGGKTVTLKTLGLLAVMAQSGLHIPCEPGSTIRIFSQILADIGDEQSIEQSLSTFSAHMVNTVNILKNADENSLVLFDELGAGTDPIEGAALATAILEKIRTKRSLCAATTHYAELKMFALDTDGVCNASCEFDINTLKPTYRLILGTPGKSNAFAISSKLGLDSEIISHAKALVSGDDRRFENVIEKLESQRLLLDKERENLEKEKSKFNDWKTKKETEINSAEMKAHLAVENAEKKANSIMQSARMSSEFIFDELDKIKKEKDKANFGVKLDETKNRIKKNLRRADNKLNPVEKIDNDGYVLPRPLKVGDTVLVTTLGVEGVVMSLPNKSGILEVKCGIMSTKIKSEQLQLVENNPTITTKDGKKTQITRSYSPEIRDGIKPEIDLRGMTGEDAWLSVDKYIDQAQMSGLTTVTLIHGKGTGALKKALITYLRTDKRIKSFRGGQYGEGDGGVTVLELK